MEELGPPGTPGRHDKALRGGKGLARSGGGPPSHPQPVGPGTSRKQGTTYSNVRIEKAEWKLEMVKWLWGHR